MVSLIKTLSRVCLRLCDRRGRLMIVNLEPGDMLSFRAKGTRTSYRVHLGQCLVMAEILQIETYHREAVQLYNEKRKAGYKRLRRPRKPGRVFSNFYLTAINTNPKNL